MIEGQPSRTAIRCTVLRAAHQVLDGDPKVLRDPIAVGLVEGSREKELRSDAQTLQGPTFRAIRAVLIMRSRYVEDLLESEAAAGIRQFVILGAGLDTFAYRQPAWAGTLALFEVDHPATQEWKRAVLKQARITQPSNLRFCPVDFETTALPEALKATGFNFQSPAVFSWLGVTQYLTQTAIDSTLRFILSLPPGSSIVFTFVLPDSSLDPSDVPLLATAVEIASAGGEPFITRFEPTTLRARLASMGFSEAVHFSSESANESYFLARPDGLRTPSWEHLIWATV